MKLHSFSDAKLLNEDLALQISTLLNNAIQQRGQAYLVVSGGKTPVELFKILAQSTIAWDKVIITLADERCVPYNDSERNEYLVKKFLIQDQAKNAHFLSLYDEQISLEECLKDSEQRIASIPLFDVVLLGMGEDGHTASLFPCSAQLQAALADDADAVVLIKPQNAPYDRISLSKKRLLHSAAIFFHLIGEKKRLVLNQAMAEHDPMIMPASAFLNNHNANIQVMYAP